MAYRPNTVTITLRYNHVSKTRPVITCELPTYKVTELFAALNDIKTRYIEVPDTTGGRHAIRVADIDTIHADGGDA